MASASPASPAVPAASQGRGSSAPAYEPGSYRAIDVRDAEARVYAKRRREQVRRDALRVVAIVAAGVAVLAVALVASGLLG